MQKTIISIITLFVLLGCTSTDKKTECLKGVILQSSLCLEDNNKTSCKYLLQILSDDITIGSPYTIDDVVYQNVIMANIVQQVVSVGDTITFTYENRNQELTKDCCTSNLIIINMATIVINVQETKHCD